MSAADRQAASPELDAQTGPQLDLRRQPQATEKSDQPKLEVQPHPSPAPRGKRSSSMDVLKR